MSERLWIPLECNPEVMNRYLSSMGVTSTEYAFHDVFGFEKELLDMVPRPVLAVLLLFPISKATEELRLQQREQAEKDSSGNPVVRSHCWFMKQTVPNACGTIGMIHAVSNNADTLHIDAGSFFSSFLAGTAAIDPEQRAAALESSSEISKVHETSASEGQSVAPTALEDLMNVNNHFIAFVCRDEALWELDGRKHGPIYHGPTTRETLLEDAVRVIQDSFVALNPGSNQFSMLALARADADAE